MSQKSQSVPIARFEGFAITTVRNLEFFLILKGFNVYSIQNRYNFRPHRGRRTIKLSFFLLTFNAFSILFHVSNSSDLQPVLDLSVSLIFHYRFAIHLIQTRLIRNVFLCVLCVYLCALCGYPSSIPNS